MHGTPTLGPPEHTRRHRITDIVIDQTMYIGPITMSQTTGSGPCSAYPTRTPADIQFLYACGTAELHEPSTRTVVNDRCRSTADRFVHILLTFIA